jgi:hypothetical protein
MFQVHLSGKGLCGRAVRYETLDAEQIEQIEAATANALGKEVLFSEYRRKVAMEALGRMISSYTEPVAEKDLPAAKWLPRPPDGILRHWKELFGARDSAMLRQIYEREHSVSDADVEAIMGKKVAVVED